MKTKERFTADFEAASLRQLPLEQLRQRGVRGLIFDLDNTITGWHSMEISEEVRQWFAALPMEGFSACILSNSHQERVLPMGELLGLPALHMANKPLTAGYLKACRQLGLPPEQVAMVGDQLLTDIWGGNRAGLTTVLLTELVDDHEFFATRLFARRVEKLLRQRKK